MHRRCVTCGAIRSRLREHRWPVFADTYVTQQEPVCGGDERKARTVSLHCHDPCAAHNTVSSSLEAVSGHRALASASAPHLWCHSQMMDATVSSLRLPREKTLKLMFHRCVVDFSPLQLSRDKRVQLTLCPLELFAA